MKKLKGLLRIYGIYWLISWAVYGISGELLSFSETDLAIKRGGCKKREYTYGWIVIIKRFKKFCENMKEL